MLTIARKARAQRHWVLTKYNAWRKVICSTSFPALTSARVLVTASTAPLSLSGRGSYLGSRSPHREGSRPPPSAEDGEGPWTVHWKLGHIDFIISNLLTCNSQQWTVASPYSFWKSILENHTFALKLHHLFKSSWTSTTLLSCKGQKFWHVPVTVAILKSWHWCLPCSKFPNLDWLYDMPPATDAL